MGTMIVLLMLSCCVIYLCGAGPRPRKQCPACHEYIRSGATRCRYCTQELAA